MMDPDLPLMEAAASGSKEALSQLMARHRDAVYRFAYRYTGNATDAADITQETFIRAWFNAPRFKPKAKVSTWLFTITTRLCHDHARHNKRWKIEALESHKGAGSPKTLSEQLVAPGTPANDSVRLADDLQQLRKAIQNLPHKLRAPLILCAIEERSHREAATILGTSEKAIETRIYRARQKLAEVIKAT